MIQIVSRLYRDIIQTQYLDISFAKYLDIVNACACVIIHILYRRHLETPSILYQVGPHTLSRLYIVIIQTLFIVLDFASRFLFFYLSFMSTYIIQILSIHYSSLSRRRCRGSFLINGSHILSKLALCSVMSESWQRHCKPISGQRWHE